MDNTEPENKKSDWKKFFNSAGSLTAVVVPLFGLFVGYKKLIEERPNLVVQIEHVSLNGYVQPDTILQELDNIEEQYGLSTGDHILQLKKTVKKLDTKFLDSTDVIKLIAALYENICFFQQSPPKQWGYNDISYDNGIITWPDGSTYNTKDDKTSPTVLGKPTDSISLQKLKQRAYSLYQPFNIPVREAIANRLRVVRTKLNRLADHPSHFLEIQIRVINRSTQPNMLFRTARFNIVENDAKNKGANLLTLLFSNESVVGGLSEAHMLLRSKIADQLKPNTNLHKVFSHKKKLSTQLTLIDVENHRWIAESQLDVSDGLSEVIESDN